MLNKMQNANKWKTTSQHTISSQEGSPNRKIDNTERNLRMIFKSYSRLSACSSAQQCFTFDQVQKEYQSLKLATFIKFCRDFKIPIKLSHQIQAFNIVVEQSAQLKYNQQKLEGNIQQSYSPQGTLDFDGFKRALAMCFELAQKVQLQEL